MLYIAFLYPFLQFAVVMTIVYFLFRILDGIRKTNLERNQILEGIHEELKKKNL